jgi:hypothetical protein
LRGRILHGGDPRCRRCGNPRRDHKQQRQAAGNAYRAAKDRL